MSGVSWVIRPEHGRIGAAARVENVSRSGAQMCFHHASSRVDRMVRAAMQRDGLLEFPIVPLHGPRKARVRWTTVGEDGQRRLGLEWTTPLGDFPSLASSLSRPAEQEQTH